VKHQWIDTGDTRIGLRWSEPGLDVSLPPSLRSQLTDGAAPSNISVLVGEQDGGTRNKHEVFVQGELILVSGSDERVRRAVVRSIVDLATSPPPDSVSLWAAAVIADDGQAILVDRRVAHELWNLDRRLRRQGYRVVDSACVAVDPATGSVLLTDPTQLVDPDAARAVMAELGDDDGFDDLRGGPRPISLIVFAGDDADDGDLAKTLAEAAPMVSQADGTLRVASVERLLELLRRVDSRSVLPDDRAALIHAIGLDRS
jgi:hypothetical protein